MISNQLRYCRAEYGHLGTRKGRRAQLTKRKNFIECDKVDHYDHNLLVKVFLSVVTIQRQCQVSVNTRTAPSLMVTTLWERP